MSQYDLREFDEIKSKVQSLILKAHKNDPKVFLKFGRESALFLAFLLANKNNPQISGFDLLNKWLILSKQIRQKRRMNRKSTLISKHLNAQILNSIVPELPKCNFYLS